MFGWAGRAFCDQAGNFLRVCSTLRTSDRGGESSGIHYVEPGEKFVLSHRECYDFVYIVVDGAVVNYADDKGSSAEGSRGSSSRNKKNVPSRLRDYEVIAGQNESFGELNIVFDYEGLAKILDWERLEQTPGRG